MKYGSEVEPKKPGMKVHVLYSSVYMKKSTVGRSVDRGKTFMVARVWTEGRMSEWLQTSLELELHTQRGELKVTG